MGLMKRLSTVFQAKASKVLDKAEDPRETLDFSYQKQLELLTKVRRGVADVATSRKRLELQAGQLQASAAKLDGQARQAMGAGREDLAREALTRRAAIATQLSALATQHTQLDGEEKKLVDASRRLEAKVEAFRTQKETIKATYTAAEAQTKIGEAFSGISEEMGDVGLAVQRAEEKTLAMQSRAGAIDELMASGALDDVTRSSDPLQAELDRVTATSSVDAELGRLKAELSAGSTAGELGSAAADKEDDK
ncbi:MAG: PspA/IM30 family protein [Acidimicrobiales bacterium]